MTSIISSSSKISSNKNSQTSLEATISLLCAKCNKTFKTKKSKTRHVLKQICTPLRERTYCEPCSFTASSIEEYKKHLVSINHLSCISDVKTRPIEIEKPTDLFALDPYLTKEEKQASKQAKFLSFTHKDNTITRIDIARENAVIVAKKQAQAEQEELERKAIEEAKYIDGIHYVEEPENKLDYQSILNAELYTIPPKTERQKRILAFLIKAQNVSDNIKKNKLKDILRLVSMEDANYLMSHIRRCDEIELTSKQFYMAFIDSFLMELVKLLGRGIEYIGDKKIVDFVAKMSK